jgi:hypothetical protein
MAIYISKLNTGRITFDGVSIIGALGGSGDGYGADTIELVPDANLYDAHQYLVIDPTGPDHIHIRAGGPQDNSDATLILGGERTAVQVSDETGNVYIISKIPDEVNTYANSNEESNSEFIRATGADIVIGDTVQLYPDGPLFTVTSVTESEGLMTVVAEGLSFITGESYNFYRNQGENAWTFNNNGNITIPNLKDIKDADGNTVIGGGNRVKYHDSDDATVVPVDESNIYIIDTIAAPTTIKLPASGAVRIGYEFIVIDQKGNASNKEITITAELGDFIISAPTGCMIDTDYGVLGFKYVGNKNWAILYGR